MRNEQLNRYVRNITLKEIDEEGQEKLLNSKVLVIGAGGLGSPLLLYLAASGIGTIGIIDDDKVDLSNLQRQIIYKNDDVDQPKTHAAKKRLLELNPDINIITHQLRLDETNIDNIIKDYDIIADGSDNFETRFLVNERCFRHKKPLVSAAVVGFSGQVYTFKPYLDGHPCYRCIYPELPAPNASPPCREFGVLGSVVGQVGSFQATEIIKELLNIGESLSGKMIMIDALYADIKKVKINRDPNCLCCANERKK